jgi:hypothetical protein
VSIYTNTYAYTRAQAVVDQVGTLYRLAGIGTASTDRVCNAVDQRWLAAVGLYLEREGARVYEMEVRITWSAYGDGPELEFDSDLPGWEGVGSPEAIIAGTRVAAIAKHEGLTVEFWVRFTPEIFADDALYRQRCTDVGVGGKLPAWKSTPATRSLPIQDLREIRLSERSAL